MSDTLNTVISTFLFNDSYAIRVRDDGYWSATDMVKGCNEKYSTSKRMNDWTILNSTQEVINHLEARQGKQDGNSRTCFLPLILSRHGGDQTDKNSGTWIHRDLVLPLAHWLNPLFYVWCNDIINDLFEENDRKVRSELEQIYNPKYEHQIRNFVAREFNGISAEQQFKHLDKKFIPDLITPQYVIEVKNAREWDHARGQIITYRDRLKEMNLWGRRSAVLYLFDRDKWLTEAEFEFCCKTCAKNNITVKIYPYHYPTKKETVITKTYESVEQYQEQLARYIAIDLNTKKEYKLTDLKTFCKDVGIDYSHAIKCAKGKVNKVKNFKISYASEEMANMTAFQRKQLAGAQRDPDKIVVAKNLDTNEVFIVPSVREFARQNNIKSQGNINACLAGTRTKAYGYKFWYLKNLPEEEQKLLQQGNK